MISFVCSSNFFEIVKLKFCELFVCSGLIMHYVELLSYFSWSQQLGLLLLPCWVWGHLCATSETCFSMYDVNQIHHHVQHKFHSDYLLNCILSTSDLTLLWTTSCRGMTIIGKRVAHIILWPPMFNQCYCGREQHSYAGVVI